MGVSTIIVAYDGSAAARRALVHAARIVGPEGSVIVVNVIRAQSIGSRLATVSERQRARQDRLLREAEAVLASHGSQAELVAATGDPGTEILSVAAQRRATIIAVGRGRRWRRLLHASLAAHLAARAERDVLVVG